MHTEGKAHLIQRKLHGASSKFCYSLCSCNILCLGSCTQRDPELVFGPSVSWGGLGYQGPKTSIYKKRMIFRTCRRRRQGETKPLVSGTFVVFWLWYPKPPKQHLAKKPLRGRFWEPEGPEVVRGRPRLGRFRVGPRGVGGCAQPCTYAPFSHAAIQNMTNNISTSGRVLVTQGTFIARSWHRTETTATLTESQGICNRVLQGGARTGNRPK